MSASGSQMSGKWRANGSAEDIYVNKKPAQIATSCSSADAIKNARQHIPRQQFQILDVVQIHPLQHETLNTRLAR